MLLILRIGMRGEIIKLRKDSHPNRDRRIIQVATSANSMITD